jgi:anti-anti-sigma factor
MNTQIRGGDVVVAITIDEIDAHTAPGVAEHLASGLERLDEVVLLGAERQRPELLVDLSAVTFLDSTGVRALIEADLAAIQRGSRVYVTGAQGIARRCLEVAGVLEHFERRRADSAA